MSVPNLAKTTKKPSSAHTHTHTPWGFKPHTPETYRKMIQQDNFNNFQKEMQTTLQIIQEAIASHKEDTRRNHDETKSNQQKLEEKIGKMNEQVININSQIENFQEKITKNEQRIQ